MASSLARPARSTFARVATTVVAVMLVAGAFAAPQRASADAANKGGDFVPITTANKLLDTGAGIGVAKGTRPAGSTTAFQVAGVGGVPSTGVRAVVVTILAVPPSGTSGWMVLFPDGSPRPPTSVVNSSAGHWIANMATVQLPANGKVDVYTSVASDVVVEAEGYFTSATGTAGSGFVPVTMTRLVDTRNGIGTAKAKIPANGSITVTIANGSPIPTNAGAALLNVTAFTTVRGWVNVEPSGTGGNSVLDYDNNTVSSSTVVKMGSGGTATISNHGSAAIDVVVDAEGYFTNSASTGAGLRVLPHARLENNVTVAANATLNVQVGGVNGLPTRYIAGALLNLTVSGPSAGYLTAWPTGQPEPANVALNSFPSGNINRADTVAVKTGTNGMVSIRNHTSGTIHLFVDLQGWFEDPLPAVAPVAFSPTQVVQVAPAAGALVGPLEYSYVDNIGRVVYGYQPDPSSALSLQWTVISGNEAYSGAPALAGQPNGQVRLTAEHGDGNVWSALQPAGANPAWGGFANTGGSMASAPVVGAQPDGTLVLFAVDADGQLWDLPQTGPSGGWGTAWHPLGVTVAPGSVAVATVQSGIAIFAMDGSGGLHTATLPTSGGLSAWTSIGGSGLVGKPAVVVYPGYRMRIFATGGDGTIVTSMQDITGAWPAFTPVNGASVGLVAAGSPAAVLSPASGKTELVARTADGGVYSTGETAQGSGIWRDWVIVNGDPLTGTVSDPTATDPTAFTYNAGSGLTWAFVFRNADNQSRLYTVSTTPLAATTTGHTNQTTTPDPTFHPNPLPTPPH